MQLTLFFTSDYKEALIVTIDGGGIDNTDGSLHKKVILMLR